VKAHPRSDLQAYQSAGLEIVETLPNAEVYLGHYSSLLAAPVQLGKKLGLIPIEGHLIPDYFLEVGTILRSRADLESLLQADFCPGDLDHVFSAPISPEEHFRLVCSHINV
jgi:hypothetical protein